MKSYNKTLFDHGSKGFVHFTTWITLEALRCLKLDTKDQAVSTLKYLEGANVDAEGGWLGKMF